MKDKIKTALAVAFGILIAAYFVFLTVNVMQTKNKANAVISFLNQQIAASQKAQDAPAK